MSRRKCTTRVRSRGHVRLNKDTRMVSLHAVSGAYRTISERQADEMVAGGEAERVVVTIDGYTRMYWKQLVKDASKPTPTTLTLGTMEAVANAKDSRLSGAERRQVEKFQVWALIGDTKAVAVRPRITDAERRQAEKLLGMKAA